MNELLPVGTRVEIVGPACDGSNYWVGRIVTIAMIDGFDKVNPICVQVEHGQVWFPASSVKKIEDKMKITNEEQAAATKKKLEALDEYSKAFNLPFALGTFEGMEIPEEVKLRSALAAWDAESEEREFEKIELSEQAELRLLYLCSVNTSIGIGSGRNELINRGFEAVECEKVTPKGRRFANWFRKKAGKA